MSRMVRFVYDGSFSLLGYKVIVTHPKRNVKLIDLKISIKKSNKGAYSQPGKFHFL